MAPKKTNSNKDEENAETAKAEQSASDSTAEAVEQIAGQTADATVADDPEPAEQPEAPKMTQEQIEEAVRKADFSIKEKPESPKAIPPALMFDADTKVTPALIMKRVEEEKAKRKQIAKSTSENTGPRVETRADGRRKIRHN